MKTALFLTWLAVGTGDEVSTRISVTRAHTHEANPMLPPEPTQGVAIISLSAAGGASAAYLWTHQHKKLAVILTIGNAAAHGWAIQHNLKLAAGGK